MVSCFPKSILVDLRKEATSLRNCAMPKSETIPKSTTLANNVGDEYSELLSRLTCDTEGIGLFATDKNVGTFQVTVENVQIV